MTRREFTKICSLLGISASSPLFARDADFSGKVLIIGAGAAGVTAGYLLQRMGVDYQILEASNTYGGRMKRTKSFADFPIPLGAEWLHGSQKILKKIIDDRSKKISTHLQGYSGKEQVGYYEEGELSYSTIRKEFGRGFGDQKFVNSSWFDFFNQYLVPGIRKKIKLKTLITSINYHGDQVIVRDAKGANYQADKVIVTVPLQILKNKKIQFSPRLPKYKIEAINEASVWGGIKVFLEFGEKFYPTFLTAPDSETKEGQRMYFDAAFGQKTSANILGLFAVGKQARPYQNKSAKARLKHILNELDHVFDGRASRSYKRHVVQDWSKEPFIQSAYLADGAESYLSTDLFTPVKEKLYFAGEAYTREDDWGSVHNAALSARHAIGSILDW